MRASPLVAVASVVSCLLGLGLCLCLGACSSADPSAPADPRVGQTSSPIINGQVDTTHQAVVAIALQQGSQGGLCSGTIVKVDPATHIGWVLTAAHCVDIPPVLVLQSNDFSMTTGTLRYDIVDYEADSRYSGQTGSPYDFAMVRIAGVDANTPTIPLVGSPDNLTVGTNVVSVGYGRTTLMKRFDSPMPVGCSRLPNRLRYIHSHARGVSAASPIRHCRWRRRYSR